MPVFELQIRAVLDRVSSISAPSDYSWSFVFTCGSCGENTPKPVTFDESMSVDLIRGAKVTLTIKCKFCERTSEVTLLDEPHVYSDSGEFKPFVGLDCRGTSPSLWNIIEPLTIKGENGFIFEDTEIVNQEFFGYDEDLNQESSVSEFEHVLKRRR
mmetsp:Transcript_35204/g.139860  ORF Transcript_35204/g.139860 Transcript_35204/m.139860 type:complete len:156 (+) Transcript_35204:2008-2475(+)